MADRRVAEVLGDYLVLLRDGRKTQEEAEAALERLLDELAFVRHDVIYEFDAADYPDPPDWTYEDRRALAVLRFPNYGHYNTVMTVSDDIAATEVVVGDAIDDVADIAGDLADVAWALENTSQDDAMWRFCNSFDHHWGEHLRSLQGYLLALRFSR